MNAERNMPAIEVNNANPERPAVKINMSVQERVPLFLQTSRTRTDLPFGLKAGHTGETRHREKVEEYLRCMYHDDGF